MPRRESVRWVLCCPSCKKKGEVEISENENIVYSRGKFDKEVESISDGFHEGEMNGNHIEIICDKCKIPVPY
jgi:hypothetical protein